MTQLSVEELQCPPVAQQPLEIVERKGLGFAFATPRGSFVHTPPLPCVLWFRDVNPRLTCENLVGCPVGRHFRVEACSSAAPIHNSTGQRRSVGQSNRTSSSARDKRGIVEMRFDDALPALNACTIARHRIRVLAPEESCTGPRAARGSANLWSLPILSGALSHQAGSSVHAPGLLGQGCAG